MTKVIEVLESDGKNIKVLGTKFLADPKSVKVIVDGVNILENFKGNVIKVVADGVE